MKRKRKTLRAVATTMPSPRSELPMPALVLRVVLILAAAALVQHFLPHP
ncbi:hypothetical protein [Shinella sp.]|nr:hypothetical protein [Shinella sp.]MDX3973694.1 hypothetical protein [Shinella sp.]